MPIEIRELVIKATIDETAQQPQASSQVTTSSNIDDAAVQKIIDQVLSKIRNINER